MRSEYEIWRDELRGERHPVRDFVFEKLWWIMGAAVAAVLVARWVFKL